MFPVSKSVFDETMASLNIANIASATIRQIVSLATKLEEPLEDKFVHLEMGNPGLPPTSLGAKAEAEALAKGVAGVYPNIAGIPELKESGSKFLKAFLDIEVPPRCIVPTVGSMRSRCSSLWGSACRDVIPSCSLTPASLRSTTR